MRTNLRLRQQYQLLGRAHPALSAEQVAQIEARLYEGWDTPIPPAALRQLLQTDHYSAVEHRQAKTVLYALDQ